ncbi:thiol reductant ABC exporter subunit CydD [Woodsholea maritima]|uniref:thiol reductant ABC exporter subunit CydD n=1 Tax=Woodsholea maritima TaxID=240237 RepID=UPI0003714FA7|nr:thiol reductant ABC exporter subunit CydD [Woodsholea maritima]
MTASPKTQDQAPTKAEIKALMRDWTRAGANLSRLGSLLGILQYAAFAGFAACAAQALNALITGQSPWIALASALGLALLRAGLQAGEVRAGQEAALRIKADVRQRAAKALIAKGPSFAERHDSGALSSALMEGVEKLDGYFGRYKPLMPVIMGAPIVLLIPVFATSWIAGLVLLISLPLLPLFMALVGISAAKASKDQMHVLQRLAGRFQDRLGALETLNAFNAAAREREGLAQGAEDFRLRTMKVLRLAFLSSAILEFFAALSVAATAVYVGFSLLGEWPLAAGTGGEGMTLAKGAFLLIIAPEFFMPLRRFSAAYHDRADAEAAASVLYPLFAQDEAEERGAPHTPLTLHTAPSLRFHSVGSVYSDGRRGLDNLSFDVPAGSITALWGPSGVGKSTALKLLLGYAPLSEGVIEIDGQRLNGTLVGQAAWMGQRPRLFHGSLEDNIALFDPGLNAQRRDEAARIAGVMDFLPQLEAGFETALGEQGSGLSGGQGQRIALARAIALDKKLVLLDEPTAHLDSDSEARFLAALKPAMAGRTVLIATHSQAVREMADQVIDFTALTHAPSREIHG